jgi:hypothetical protein
VSGGSGSTSLNSVVGVFLERTYKRNHLCEIKRKGNYLGRIIFKE